MRAVARPDSRFGYDLTRFNPDFAGSELLFGKLRDLLCYAGDGPVFATPDNCLQDVRAGLIAAGRPLLQGVAAGLGYHFVRPGRIAPADARFGGTLDGILLLAEHLEPDAPELGSVDFVVVGATVVDPRTGVRLGRAGGPDLDWARLAGLGLVSPTTPVVICAHDHQLADTGLVPSPGDLAADWIITPTQTIRVAVTSENGAEPPRDATGKDAAWEQRLMREKVWAGFRAVARPDSRFHWDFSSFIADFEGSERCVDLVRGLPAWSRSPLLFITPDNSTELIRRAAMADGKPFVMTTYGIRRGFLRLDPADVPETERSYAATLDGMDRYARPVSLEELGQGDRIGLLVTGGSAVSLNGHRMGKGHGYFDLEWALLSEAGAVGETSEIVDVVHDCLVVDTTVAAGIHDVPVDWIITPTRTIRADSPGRSPGRVYWDLLRGTELESVPPVTELAARLGRVASAAAQQLTQLTSSPSPQGGRDESYRRQ
jgi:5-formyltetrahydrofolate cyclo-ligase